MTHSHHPHNASRRHWLKTSGLGLAAGSLGNLLAPMRSAYAADYKALVCVFLYGGNDGMNMVVPTDSARYAQYAAARRSVALPQSSLLPLTGTQFGLHPAMSALQSAWAAKRLTPVFNVGPLHAPLTKAQYLASAADPSVVPPSLFSHADQQVLWETGSTSTVTRTGWGGRAAEAVSPGYPVISVGGNGRFGLSTTAIPLVVPGPGEAFGVVELAPDAWRLTDPAASARANAVRSMYKQVQGNALGGAFAAVGNDAFGVATKLAPTLVTQPGDSSANAAINAGFASIISGGKVTTPIGNQLYQAAKLIAANSVIGSSRQVFFAQMGGFDTHSGQTASNTTQGAHAALLKQLADALAAFDAAMHNLGMAEMVTAFTQSDFGRTFASNSSSGTDHAWGNHHLVIGGAVKGGATYGAYPDLTLGGINDVGVNSWEMQGRWIPTSSVDQYAATMLKWFGATDSQLDTVLPNLRNFGTARNLGFI